MDTDRSIHLMAAKSNEGLDLCRNLLSTAKNRIAADAVSRSDRRCSIRGDGIFERERPGAARRRLAGNAASRHLESPAEGKESSEIHRSQNGDRANLEGSSGPRTVSFTKPWEGERSG